MDLVSLKRRYRVQKTLRSVLEPVWDDIDYYTGPVKDSGSSAANPGTSGVTQPQARKDLWDFTAIEGREKLAANIQQAATNAALRWFLMSWQKAPLNSDAETRGWLDEESENAWNDIQDSDFDTEMGSALDEWCGPGNMFIAVEPMPPEIVESEELDPKTKRMKKTIKEEWAGVDFTHVPLREGYFEPDRKGDIRTFWRRLMYTPAQVVSLCEDMQAKAGNDAERKAWTIPADILERYEKGDGKPAEYVNCIFQRPEIIRLHKVRYPAAPKNRPWGSVWWREDTGDQMGLEGGYYEKPIFHAPWRRIGGSHWGYGPGNVALPTVKFVNARKQNVKASEELSINSPYAVNERDLLSDLDLRPGGATLTRGDPRTAIMPLGSNTKFDVAYESMQDDIGAIRRIFYLDELILKDSPQMTAAEAWIRYELMNRLLGKPLTFLQSGALGPILTSIIQMRIRMGASKPMPKKARAAGGVFSIEYQGPLARSQRTDEVAAIERGATFVLGLAQGFPEVRAAFKPVEAVKHAFKRLGVPASMIPTDKEIAEGIKRIQDAQDRMMQAEAQQKEAKAAKDRGETQPVRAGAFPMGAGGQAQLPPQPPMDLQGVQGIAVR